MADMAPALTGAAQEAPHRLKLSASSPAWKARSGLLLLNGGEKGRPAREEDGPGRRPEDATGPRGVGKRPLELTEGPPGEGRRKVRARERLEEAVGGPSSVAIPAPGPTEPLEDATGPSTGLNPALGPKDRREEAVVGPSTALNPALGPGSRPSSLLDNAPGPRDRPEAATGPSTMLNPGPAARRNFASCPSKPGPMAAQHRLEWKDGSALRERRVDGAPGPTAGALPPGPGERLEEAMGPATVLNSSPGPRSRPAAPSHQDSRYPAPRPAPECSEKRKDRPEPRGRGVEGVPGPAAQIPNAKGRLAGQDSTPTSTGRTEVPSERPGRAPGPPAVESFSQGCVPGSRAPEDSAPGSSPLRDSSKGPVDSQDAAPGPRVSCSLRAAQMSGRQQELGARARRLCRRLQVIQAKQVERHVRQQLSGLVELLSERGADGLPGSPHVELDRLACSSTARLRAAQGGFDSDATESSSGGESDTEEEEESGSVEEEEQNRAPGSNQHSEWRWAVERAAIICRWSWLQAQVSDLEFRIRQQTEIYKQIRCTKGSVVLGDSPHCEDSASRQAASSSLNARGNRVPSSCPKPPSEGDPRDSLCNTPTPIPHSLDKQCSRLTQSVENVACQNPPTTPVCDSPGSQKASRQVNGLINCVRSSASCNGSAEDLDPEEVLGKKRRVDLTSTSPADSTCVSARTRPLRGHKKRSVVRSSDVSSLSRKPQKPLSTKCGCDPPTTCIMCGCKTYAKTLHPSAMAVNERLALMDPSYHPILSFPYDTPLHLHFEALLKEDRQFRVSNKLKILKLSQLAKKPQDASRSMFRDDRPFKAMSSPSIHVSSPVTPRPNPAAHQLPSLTDTPPSGSQQNSTSAALKRKRFENSYDIDNIVIPMSLVAASRVEKLQYKEILTPSWRVLDSAEKETLELDPQLEDLCDETYQDRHSKYEELERSRWDSWASAVPQRRGSRSSNRSDGRWTPQPPNSQQMASPDIRFHSLNDVPLSLSSAAADNPEPYSTVQCRSRVLSWSEDTRSSTPEIPDEEEQIIQPWEHRSFPLSDRDCRSLHDLPGTPSRVRPKPHPDVSWPLSSKPGTWTESIDSGMSTENLTPASKEPPTTPNSISVVRVRAHSGDKIASLEYFPPRPVNKR